ncbi:radical SAM protein [bacterium]|nr:radical SAM protein [candidate division CSSED10-310 bacterium]
MALVYPAPYAIGMSNLAIHLVYAAFNAIPGVACHRFFADSSVLDQRIADTPLKPRSIETGDSLSSYHVIAFSLNYENDLLNIPRILNGAGIPVRVSKRGSSEPIVIAGGVIATINPEVLAPFIDAFILGESEEIIPPLTSALADVWVTTRNRAETHAVIAQIPGVYIPAWYEPIYDRSGRYTDIRSNESFPLSPLKRRFIPDLNKVPGSMIISTPHTEFQRMHLVEISRGCPRTCRFCLIPRCYGPFRYRSVDTILSEAKHAPKNWRIGLLGAGGADHPGLKDICRRLAEEHYRFTFSSLHTTGITDELSFRIREAGPKTLTLAPEVGSDHRRRRMGKFFSNEDIIDAVHRLARDPIRTIKLYFMIGLPGETSRDLDAIVELCRTVQGEIRSANRNSRTIPRLAAGISCFVPKAMSSFERASMVDEKDLKKRLEHITNQMRSIREMRFTHDTPRWASVQGLLARGDRRLADWLEASSIPGADWYNLFKSIPKSVTSGIYKPVKLREVLPWDHLKVPLFCEEGPGLETRHA